MLKRIRDAFFKEMDEGQFPNSYTLALGQLIRDARQQAGMTQQQLARRTYKRQAFISEMENGKIEPTASTLLLLSYALDKPISYFFPREFGTVQLKGEDLEREEQELIFRVRRLYKYPDDGRVEVMKLITQVKALADLAESKFR